MNAMDLRARLNPKRLIAGDPPPSAPSPLPPGGGQAVGAGDLAERRDALARELAELQWDLGGLAYEMAIRDHFRLDVLVRQAGRLQEVDARLGEVEHLLRLDTTGAAGACPRCGTLYARGALFCSQCAFQLVDVQGVDGAHLPATPASLSPATAPAAPPPADPMAPDAHRPAAGATAPEQETLIFDAPARTAPAAPDAPYGIAAPSERATGAGPGERQPPSDVRVGQSAAAGPDEPRPPADPQGPRRAATAPDATATHPQEPPRE
jgi:hypothetical protein